MTSGRVPTIIRILGRQRRSVLHNLVIRYSLAVAGAAHIMMPIRLAGSGPVVVPGQGDGGQRQFWARTRGPESQLPLSAPGIRGPLHPLIQIRCCARVEIRVYMVFTRKSNCTRRPELPGLSGLTPVTRVVPQFAAESTDGSLVSNCARFRYSSRTSRRTTANRPHPRRHGYSYRMRRCISDNYRSHPDHNSLAYKL